jgi:hypothetical protein
VRVFLRNCLDETFVGVGAHSKLLHKVSHQAAVLLSWPSVKSGAEQRAQKPRNCAPNHDLIKRHVQMPAHCRDYLSRALSLIWPHIPPLALHAALHIQASYKHAPGELPFIIQTNISLSYAAGTIILKSGKGGRTVRDRPPDTHSLGALCAVN